MSRVSSNAYLTNNPNLINGLIPTEFPIAHEQEFSHFFSCVTIGNTLALTATFREELWGIVEEVMNRLYGF